MEAAITYKSNWWGYIGKRVFIALIVFILISMLIFFTIRIGLGSHADSATILGLGMVHISPSQEFYTWYEEQRELHHFNEPLILQYFRWMGGVFTGDFGESLLLKGR